LLDVLAGDLVPAGPEAGHSDSAAWRRSWGRRTGWAPVCPAPRDGCGAGLMPDPAVEAFAERAAAGTLEQPPICGAPEGLQVPAQEAGKLRGDRDRPGGAFRAVFEAAGFAWGAVAGPGPR
jgi:hypothetical protein